jgi:anti-sigma28 factor (negative regulator of flagellin synthesis)
MISTIQTSNMAYVQPTVTKDDLSKGITKTEQSEGVDKISAIKEQIDNGTYKVDLTKTAQAAAEELI